MSIMGMMFANHAADQPSWGLALNRWVLRLGAGVALASQLGGCTTERERAADRIAPVHADVAPTFHDIDALPEEPALLAQWWARFDDPILTQLIARAAAQNNDIAAAIGRLRTSRAAVDAARAGQLPSIGASGGASRQETVRGGGGGSTAFSAGIDASWEVDLFGRLSGSVAAARADFAGSVASRFDVQRVILADVALNYLNLRDAQARLAIAQANLDIQRDNLQIAEWRNQAGLVNALDVEQARTLVAQTEASLPALRQSIATAIHQIDVLTAQAPGSSFALLTPVRPVPEPPAAINAGLPASLLERRPDIIASRRDLEAAVIRIGVAQADLYPALRLSGNLNTAGASLGGLFGSAIGNLVGNITAPIFEGGRIRARIEQQRGTADAALANYRQAILTALQDVENALVAMRTARDREAALLVAEAAARETVRLAEIRYRSGATDFQILLDAQRSLLNAQDSRQSAATARATAAVQLFRALGGGWPASAAANGELP